jgi:UDP-2,4-diacetamido-2,4,6-trideoxy-beta-L-altropyranose hydrolase
MFNTVVIRVDSSDQIGSGHVMRCLALAKELKNQKTNVIFLARELIGNYNHLIENQGFTVKRLLFNVNTIHSWSGEEWQVDAEQSYQFLTTLGAVDILIVDHYGLDARWEMRQKPAIKKLMVIDDLANRSHDCDMLLDSNLYLNQSTRYHDLIPEACTTLFGSSYVLLRKEFLNYCIKPVKRTQPVKNILISLGGLDRDNVTEKIIVACNKLSNVDLKFSVVVGLANPHQEKLQTLCKGLPNFSYYCQIKNMAELMQTMDLSIGAGGSTMWERCCLGLPALTVSLAPLEESFCEVFDKIGAQHYLGKAAELTPTIITEKLAKLIADKDKRYQMSKAATQLVDGLGIIRTITELETLLSKNI